MANSIITYTGDGTTTQFPLNFTLGILSRAHVRCRVGTEVDGSNQPVYRVLEWITDGLVNVQGAPAGNGVPIVFTRTVPKDTLVHNYENGAVIQEANLDDSNKQTLMAIHEFLDGRMDGGGFGQNISMNGFRITELGDAVDLTDAVNLGQLLSNTGNAPGWAELARRWATEVEDTPVDGGEFSALHHAAKAAASASTAGTARDTAVAAQAGALSARTGAETARDVVIAAVEGVPYRDIIFVTAANSPITLTSAQRGYMYVCDTSSGNIVINLPTIAPLTMPFTLGFKKSTGDANTVTINRGGTDQIDVGGTQIILSSVSGINLAADKDTTPDSWVTASFGASAGETKNQSFVASTHFTPGSTTTLTLTNTPVAPSSSGILIFFDGLCKFPSEYTYNPTTGDITFTSPIPMGVAQVFVTWQASSVSIGVPSDGSVTLAKLASALIGVLSDVVGSVANKLVTAVALRQYVSPWVAYTPTFTGLGTVSSVNFMSRRVGDTLEVEGTFTTGTTTSVEVRISLGYAGTNGNVTTRSGMPTVSVAGQSVKNQSGSYHHFVLKEPGVTYMTFGRSGTAENGLNKVQGSGDFPSSYIYSLKATFPIQGW